MRPHVLLIVFLATSLVAQNLTIQKSNTTENLRGISVLSNQVAWSSGTHGTYLRTTDGGASWHTAQVPNAEALDFRDVEAFSVDLAYLLSAGPGEQSRIYKTTDAGKTWALQFTNKNPKGFFDCMAFWDRDRGIALGDPVIDNSGKLKFELIATANGGTTWEPLSTESLLASHRGRRRICRQRNLHRRAGNEQCLVRHRREGRACIPLDRRRQNLDRRRDPDQPRARFDRNFLHRIPRCHPRRDRWRRLQTSRPGRPAPRLHQRQRPHLDSVPYLAAKIFFRRSLCQAAFRKRRHPGCGNVPIRLRR